MPVLESIFTIATAKKLRVVMPEMEDPRIASAASRLEKDGIASIVNLPDLTDEMIEVLVNKRGMKSAIARRMLSKPLIRAAATVATGLADVMVAGAESPTKRVIEAASLAIGLKDDVSIPSSFFLIILPTPIYL